MCVVLCTSCRFDYQHSLDQINVVLLNDECWLQIVCCAYDLENYYALHCCSELLFWINDT